MAQKFAKPKDLVLTAFYGFFLIKCMLLSKYSKFIACEVDQSGTPEKIPLFGFTI